MDKEKDKDKPKASKTAKRTHSDVSNDSNNSIDLSNLMNFQKDEIKTSLEGVTRKKDLDEATKDLIRTSDLENIVFTIIHHLLEEFQKSVNERIEEKVNIVKNEMQEKIDALN